MQIPSSLQSSLLGHPQQASLTGHFLSTLKTYEYPEHRPAILEIIDIQKSFQKFQALSHINLSLKAGEFISFLGPSGCGKTTLLRIIAGLEKPDYGKVLKKGADITLQSTEKRRCGLVFQNYALFPNLNVEENIAFGLDRNKWDKVNREQRIQQLLDLIELPDIAKKYPNQLSGGQQQRVALARAIAPRPDVLLLDEPLSALDAQVRLNLRQKIRSIQSQLNLPTIMVTHDQEEALSISDRVVVMNHGVIEQIDTPHNIYYKPQTRFVAKFIGTMNFLNALCVQANQLNVLGTIKLILNNPKLRNQQSYRIGFRPEAVELVQQIGAEADALYLPIQVHSTEFLGAKRRLFCTVHIEGLSQCEHVLQIEIESIKCKYLEEFMWIKVPSQLIHVFDEQGYALC